jgi:hypothetical protein
MAQLLGLKPIVVRVTDIYQVENGFQVTANLCFQPINSDEKITVTDDNQIIVEKKNETVVVTQNGTVKTAESKIEEMVSHVWNS